MLKEILNKLKKKKQTLKSANVLEDTYLDEEILNENIDFTITVQNNNGIFKIEISDYINHENFATTMEKLGYSLLSDKISTCLIWNSSKQKIQKGTFYIIESDNKLLNIFLDENDIKVDVRIKLNDVIEEKILFYNLKNKEYRITSFRHDKFGSTFYNKYYPGTILPKALVLSKEEVIEDVEWILTNFKELVGTYSLIDINLLEQNILMDLKDKKKSQELDDSKKDVTLNLEDSNLVSKKLVKKL